MADSNQSTDDVGTHTQTRNLLLKRNPHLRVNDTYSPGFGGLGTRQFLQKQLMTPGSATSASSFEEASYDGFSDAGTPSETLTKSQQSLYVKTSEPNENVTRTSKQPTKRLSSPSRESLARRLMDSSSKHGMLPNEESKNQVDMMEGKSDLPPSGMLSNIVVKTIPSISVGGEASTMVPLSPRSSKVTRRIVASPRKTMRRVVIRKTGADGKVHEEVQYVDADGQIVQGGNFFNEGEETSSGRTTVTRRISTPAKTVRRVIVRRTGEDGQVHEEVQYLDADGNVVETQNATSTVTTSSATSTPSRSTITRRTVIPGKLTRRILRRTGADGQVHEEMQYLDVDGNVVKTEGDAGSDSISSSSGTVVTRTVTPGKTIRRVVVHRTGADGQMHEEVQFVDADGNVVQSDGSTSVKSNFSEDEDLTEETLTNEGSSDAGRTKVTHRVIRRMVVQKDGTSVPVEQYVDSDGNVIEGGALVSTGSFTDSNSGTSSRRVTRRVVASPVRRTVVHKAGSSSGAESEEDVHYVESDGDDLAHSGSFTKTVNTQSGSGRRVITRRVVTPQRVVRRMVVRKGTAGSGAEADVEDLDYDAELVSSDESVGGSSRGDSSRGGYTVSDRIVIPGDTRRVVSRSVVSSNQQEEVENVLTGIDASLNEKVVINATTTNQSEVNSPTRVGVAVVTEPQEGETSPEPTQKIDLSSSVVSDYFTKAEDEEKPNTSTTKTVEVSNNDDARDEQESSEIGPVAMTGAGSTVVACTIADESTPTDEEVEVTAPEDVAFTVVDSAEPHAAGTRIIDVPEDADALSAVPAGTPGSLSNSVTVHSMPAPAVIEVERRSVSLEDATPMPEGNSSHSDAVIPAVVAGVAGATVIKTAADHTEVIAPASNEPTIDTKTIADKNSEKPHHTQRNSGGGFWGFFGKSEDPKEDNNMDADVAVVSEVATASSPVVKTVVETSDVALDRAPEVSESPREEVVLPAEAGATAVLVDTSAATRASEGQESNEVTSPDAPAVMTTTTTKTETVEEESHGGFWGFFGKSEPKKPQTSDVVPSKSEDTTTPATTTVVTEELASPTTVTKTSLESHESEVENPSSAALNENVEDEDKSTIPSSDIVDTPEAQHATATVSTTEVSPKSPRDSKILETAALAGAAGVAAAAAVDALGNKEPDAHAAAHIPKTNSGEVPVEEEAAEPVSVPAPIVPHSIVTTTETTTVTEDEFESPSKVPHRKTGRSIWKFWGSDKPKSPLNEDEKANDMENRAVGSVAAPVAVTGVTNEEQVSVGDVHQYWQQQDKQHPTYISYAAAEGATYCPESKFEPMPAPDKTRSPAARGQGAAVESPREENVKPNNAAAAGGIVVTKITETTVEVEEEFDTGSIYHDAAETGTDIAVVTESQQFVEHESVEREEPKDAKLARAGGFWGFLGKKESTTTMTTTGSNAKKVSWSEGNEGKLHPDSTKDEEKAATAASVLQVESVRRSIPSDGTPSNVAGPEASSGKLVRGSERRTTELIDGVEPDIELDEHYVQVASPRHGGHAMTDEGQWAVKPCSLAWSKLRLYRHNWENASAQSDSNDVVLDDLSGSVKAGEFLVITGPSKDESLALLSCLAGYDDAMEGNVTVNGREWNEKMNRYIAYVMREDLFYETLTVHEHLVIQAQLRMRRTHTDEMCLERVERVIDDMGLSECRDKLIGGGGISLRGITRGERKLLALATALLTNPSILLVEEPTDGLDTFSAEKIVAKLRWLAFEKGLTVAVTLHHPSSHFYGLFDVLYLVANGSCVYDGKAADCVAYFSMIGYQCPEYMSPMDYFMLQMVVGDRESDDEGVARVETLKREWAERNPSVYAENSARAAAASEDAVVDDYDQKNRYYHMGCCDQLWLLWARHVCRLSRYGFVFWWHLLAALLIGVVFGLVYLQLDLDDQEGIQNFSGSFFYIAVIQMLFIAYRTFVFMPRETAIALRERQEYRGSWYHLLCWYCTKIIAELPALIILSIALFVPVILLVGIGHGFKVYIYMQIVMVLAGWAAIAWAFLTLGVLRNVTLALIVYAVLLVLFVAFGGLLINVTDIPDWLVWLHYISPVRYAYEAMMKIFWKRVDSIDCDWTLEGCVALTGEGVLKYYSMENRSALGDSLILLAICFAVFFVAFWFLLALANKRICGLQWRYDWAFKGPLGRMQHRVMNTTVNEKQAATRNSMQRALERKSHHSSSAAVERSTVVEGDNYYIRVETPRVGSHGVCDAPSITLGWSSLWLKAQTDKKTKINDQQYLLSDASGSAKCGELVLITGPSDESNVALLESLGGLQKGLKGKVTLNGVASTAQKVSKSAAYVARDDLFYETLTVEEHLQFQAQLVVGNSSSDCGLCCGSAGDLEAERVEMVLDELELTSKRHVLIRYLSAADAKLLAIATALLTNTSILLTEEPTCGMDFYSSQRVVLKLRQLARGGRTVVVTMAHPSSHLYALFDSLYLLAGGAAVYHGKVKEAVPYFASLGYQCPQYMNPVDYFIRQVSVSGKDNETATLFKEAWSTRYSELCLTDNNEEQEAQGGVVASHRRVGCCGQLSLLFRRHILRLARYQAVFGWHAFWMIVLGMIFGLIFLQLDLDEQQDIQNWVGAFFYIIVLQMLVIAYRTFLFLPREMAIAEREHRFGGYYMVCWYLTKVFAELPAMLILSILLFVPAYLLIGIGHGFKLYFYMQIVMWLSGWSAAGMASLLLGLFHRVRVALIVYMLLLILSIIFGGLLINVDDVPDYLIWLHYISPVKYGYEAVMKLFWGRIGFLACGGSDGSGSGSTMFANVGDPTVGDDYSFSMSGSESYEDDDGCIAHSGDEVLSHYSMEKSRDARSDTIILLELTVLYVFIGYAFLSLRWRRYKTRQQRHSATNTMEN